jgi:hypothetical protein
MSTKARYEGGVLRYYDGTTFETVHAMAPLWWKEDFNTQALDTTNNWTLLDTGDATEALVEDAPNGVVALALAATSEAELAGLSWNDKRQLVLNQGLNIEYRFRFSVLPSASTSIVAIGLAGDHNATLDTVAESIIFRADGSGAITVETDDTSNETSKVATGVTVTTADWVVGRIDCTDYTSVKFYLNGNRVADGTTFTMATVPTLALQPYARISKASSTSVGTVQIDYCKVWQNRSA